MAVAHVVAGPVTVKFGTAGSEATLGYSRDGVQIRIEPRWGDVYSDDFGGQGGAPADSQLLGAVCSVSCELTKYEATEVNKLTSFKKAGTDGTLGSIGGLVRQDSLYGSLKLDGANEDYTFSVAFPRGAFEVNKGTKFSTVVLQFETWIDATATKVLFTHA